MKKKLLTSLAALFAGAGLAMAQSPAPMPLPAIPLPTVAAPVPVVADNYIESRGAESGPPIWGSAEYMLMWTKAAPISVPTLTTFVPGSPSAATGQGGDIGVPGTIVLSPNHQDFGALSGLRTKIGAWLGDGQIGFEIGGFVSQSERSIWSFASSPGGTPDLRVPFFNVAPAGSTLFPVNESSFVLSFPGFQNGGQTIISQLQLWGTEANALWNVVNRGSTQVSLIGGFRYLDLSEDLSIYSRETIIGGATFVGTDEFRTRNQFYGGQIGAKAETEFGRFFVGVMGEVALGVDHESVAIGGLSSAAFPGFNIAAPGGIFTQSTNLGRRTHDAFSVVPEAQIRLGMNLASWLRVFVAYNFLYESDVVRPGDQIDRSLNLTSNAVIVPPGSLVGPARPLPLFNHTDFWAQSVSFGVELRY
jgi:Putative beta barrel porin-7 (BBP7)